MATHEYAQNGLTFRTVAEKVDNDWYEWRVELANGPEQLAQVKKVEYILHPTFPDRIRVKKNADKNFALESEGWGEFDIVANVFFKDGDEKTAIVPLKFT